MIHNDLASIISVARKCNAAYSYEFKLNDSTLLKYVNAIVNLPKHLELSNPELDAEAFAYMQTNIVPIFLHFAACNDASVSSKMFYWQNMGLFVDSEHQALQAIHCLLDASLSDDVRLRQCIDSLLTICMYFGINMPEMISEYIEEP